jgi:hypothetical protein
MQITWSKTGAPVTVACPKARARLEALSSAEEQGRRKRSAAMRVFMGLNGSDRPAFAPFGEAFRRG